MKISRYEKRKANEKRQRMYLVLAAVFVALLAIACGALYAHKNIGTDGAETAATTSADKKASQSLDEKADAIVSEMSLTEKIGQMVMIGVHGTDITDDSRSMLRQFHIGGVILFDRNLESAEQTKALVAHLQDYAQGEEAHQKVPLFIAIDEEGGDVVRGKSFLTPPPSQQEIGQTGDPAQAGASAERTARALRALGINVNFAPVADVGSPDRRSYAKDAAMVSAFVDQAANGYESEGIFYALKHFPGIGKGRVDSHKEVSTVDASKATLEAEDLVPFRDTIASRAPENYFILVSHLIYPALDPDHSASLSKNIMTDLLRNEMGYNGIIITDDMEMGAVANHVPYRKLGVLAVQAGADIVMICHEYEHENDIYMGILEAAQAGEISEAQIDASVRRIVRAKLAHDM
ncbi:glycoside hydrolase family 3 protein [uncultured Selenomonas sp.]|uniref:glycoside hydrolase family 3 N-terminal domain-containing protein n=1 Tax=uncultured Selenomonas sp. TaxID=159275 RepID=UPI0025E4ACCF|nr:glycoside hydrolase family 3 protein [uncultured Selenomonas sp.]